MRKMSDDFQFNQSNHLFDASEHQTARVPILTAFAMRKKSAGNSSREISHTNDHGRASSPELNIYSDRSDDDEQDEIEGFGKKFSPMPMTGKFEESYAPRMSTTKHRYEKEKKDSFRNLEHFITPPMAMTSKHAMSAANIPEKVSARRKVTKTAGTRKTMIVKLPPRPRNIGGKPTHKKGAKHDVSQGGGTSINISQSTTTKSRVQSANQRPREEDKGKSILPTQFNFPSQFYQPQQLLSTQLPEQVRRYKQQVQRPQSYQIQRGGGQGGEETSTERLLSNQKVPSKFFSAEDVFVPNDAQTPADHCLIGGKSKTILGGFATADPASTRHQQMLSGQSPQTAPAMIDFSLFTTDSKIKKNIQKASATPNQQAVIEAKRIQRQHMKSVVNVPSCRNSSNSLAGHPDQFLGTAVQTEEDDQDLAKVNEVRFLIEEETKKQSRVQTAKTPGSRYSTAVAQHNNQEFQENTNHANILVGMGGAATTSSMNQFPPQTMSHRLNLRSRQQAVNTDGQQRRGILKSATNSNLAWDQQQSKPNYSSTDQREFSDFIRLLTKKQNHPLLSKYSTTNPSLIPKSLLDDQGNLKSTRMSGSPPTASSGQPSHQGTTTSPKSNKNPQAATTAFLQQTMAASTAAAAASTKRGGGSRMITTTNEVKGKLLSFMPQASSFVQAQQSSVSKLVSNRSSFQQLQRVKQRLSMQHRFDISSPTESKPSTVAGRNHQNKLGASSSLHAQPFGQGGGKVTQSFASTQHKKLLLSYSTSAMKYQEERAKEKEEKNTKKLAPEHAPALYSNMHRAAQSQQKIRRLQQKSGILMSTFIKNQNETFKQTSALRNTSKVTSGLEKYEQDLIARQETSAMGALSATKSSKFPQEDRMGRTTFPTRLSGATASDQKRQKIFNNLRQIHSAQGVKPSAAKVRSYSKSQATL